jgi:hypothetical protein
MEFIHHPERIVEMLQEMIGLNHVERVRPERIWKNVQIMNDIWIDSRIGVQIHEATFFESATTNV